MFRISKKLLSIPLRASYSTESQNAASKLNRLSVNVEKIDFEKNQKAQETARSLIFGDRTYKNLNHEEKKIVNAYQAWILSFDGGLLLPNTELGERIFPILHD